MMMYNTQKWEKEILPDWDNKKSLQETKELWWEGLPPRVRGIVWATAVGNRLGLTQVMFKEYLRKAEKLKMIVNLEEASKREQYMKLWGSRRNSKTSQPVGFKSSSSPPPGSPPPGAADPDSDNPQADAIPSTESQDNTEPTISLSSPELGLDAPKQNEQPELNETTTQPIQNETVTKPEPTTPPPTQPEAVETPTSQPTPQEETQPQPSPSTDVKHDETQQVDLRPEEPTTSPDITNYNN